jgi:23S rRNA pseudouridine1911/1915/1917 synthase
VPERPSDPTLAARVRAALGVSWGDARDLCRTGRVRVDGVVERDPARRVRADAAVACDPRAPKERRGVLADDAIVHLDRWVVVVDKPPNVLTLPYEPGDRDTLVRRTEARLRRREPRFQTELGVVQRLDKGTSGVLVFARTLDAKRHLAAQLREHDVERVYLAWVHGVPRVGTHETHLLDDRGDGLRGSWERVRGRGASPPADARVAITHVVDVRAAGDASLVTCRIETGRQHQVRIHLAEAGYPLIGEEVYVRDFAGVRIRAPRPMLHAFRLGFRHPKDEAPVRFEVPPPEDFSAIGRARGTPCLVGGPTPRSG